LGIAVSLYNEIGNVFPSTPLDHYERGYTETISSPTPDSIVLFLNSWGKMRRHFDARLIREAMMKAEGSLLALATYSFENAPLENIRNNIILAFDTIQMGAGSPVAASKTLHVLKPDLFVPWDNAIERAYGCGDDSDPQKVKTWGETYSVFLNRVQKVLLRVIRSYAEEHGHQNILNAASELRGRLYIDGKKPFAKIIDEYNFMKFTKGKDLLWV